MRVVRRIAAFPLLCVLYVLGACVLGGHWLANKIDPPPAPQELR